MDDNMGRGRDKEVEDLEVLDTARGIGEPFGARDVAQEIEKIGYESCRRKLNRLHEDGLLQRKTIGDVYVFWLRKVIQPAPEDDD